MRDSFFPDAATLTRTLTPAALKGVPAGAAQAARAFVARLLRPAPREPAGGVITLLMAAESVQHKRALVRQVVRWHNRHPLARRIRPTDINGFGSAALPFSAAQAGGQRFALFDDASLLPGISTGRLAAFALHHGHSMQPGARHWARREVGVAPGWNPAQAQWQHLQVAALKVGGRSVRRVLVGQPDAPGAPWPVLGQRIWSGPRMALASALAAMPLLAAGVWLAPLWPSASQPAPQAPVALEAPAPSPGRDPAAPRATPPAPAAMPVPLVPTAPPAPPLNTRPVASAPPMPLPGTPEPGMPIEHATDPLRLRTSPQTGARSGPALRLALMGAIGADPSEQLAFQANLRSALPQLGSHTARLSVDLMGTPDGDAVTVWPFENEAAAQRVGQALRARGILMRIAEL